jgi:hypothetical protein
MRASLFAPLILALSLATAAAQTLYQGPLPKLTAEQEAQCREKALRFPTAECDDIRSCLRPTPEEVERAASQCRLQLLAEKVRRELEAKRQR